MHPAEPPQDCALCPRLVTYRQENQARNPDWHNAPVSGTGPDTAWLLILGLAPGLSGANKTGRPFTGDASGTLLFNTLDKFSLSDGVHITNAVRCAPPQNKPLPAEIHACRPFLKARIQSLPNLTTIIALGQIAHQSALKACGAKLPKHPFAHAAVHRLHTGTTVIDSYHPSRLNTQTGRLTAEMFDTVFEAALAARP
ncbi:MAG: uracil-DNA glycosylase [Polymorphobacter sp.]|uniref:uracil-DNA glycosylase n=1 Tax=Polymorphobacter sp. TaxID=1909290 RepID=UPI003A88DF39